MCHNVNEICRNKENGSYLQHDNVIIYTTYTSMIRSCKKIVHGLTCHNMIYEVKNTYNIINYPNTKCIKIINVS